VCTFILKANQYDENNEKNVLPIVGVFYLYMYLSSNGQQIERFCMWEAARQMMILSIDQQLNDEPQNVRTEERLSVLSKTFGGQVLCQ